jgi:hypothetical protein
MNISRVFQICIFYKTLTKSVRSEVLKVTCVNMAIFWDVAPYTVGG